MMRDFLRPEIQTYQLILRDDARGAGRTIEFEASGAEAALYVAQRQCRGREAELMAGGRSLGRLKCADKGGFWVISPPATERVNSDPGRSSAVRSLWRAPPAKP
jgi:hypothetical protein